MKLRTLIAGTALAGLALVTNAGAPLGITDMPRAEAAVSISFSVFYDDLAQHGDWVQYQNAYVFVPANVGGDWRPYTLGHWVYTERYGWTWVSDEPFGWATYHYGRWGYAEDIGWYWVPGTRWGPAWVSWRRSKDYIVWAPLPPARGTDVDVSVSISVGDIPEFYWVAVPAPRFLSTDIHVVVVKEETEIRQVIERTEFVGAPQVTNNIIVNNVIDVNVVAEATGQKVEPVKVQTTDDPRQATASGEQVTVFQGEIAPDEAAKPKKLKDVKEVKKAGSGTAKGDAATEAQPVPQPDAGSTTGTATGAGETSTDTTGSSTQAPAPGTAEQGETAPPAAEIQQTEQPQPPAAAAPEQPATGEAEGQAPAEPTAQPDAAQSPEQEPGTAGEAQAPQGAGKKDQKAKKDDKKADEQACDPATNPDCPPAQ